jgi:L-alanine-DL-glutamate epimerase-like enolase superfamily enzyme
MKITSVEAYLLSCPLSERSPKRDAMLVRIATDSDLVGYAPAPATPPAKQLIDLLIAPFLVGHTVGDPDALRILFQQGPGNDPEAGRIYSAVEIALYDLAGKARELPVSELIGGRVRDRIRLYASGGSSKAEAARARDFGFTAYKMRLQGGPEAAAAAVQNISDTSGPDLDLMATALGCGYSEKAAATLAREISALRLRWLEDPLAPDDHQAHVRLRELNLVPLAGGSHEPNELRFLDLIDTAAVDYVQMDLVAQGGYATARRLFPDIARAGLRFAFNTHRATTGTALDLIAAAHLGVCWPESMVRWLEYPLDSFFFPPASDILKQPLLIERGHLVVPRAPGLGVEVDESVIWRYPWVA